MILNPESIKNIKTPFYYYDIQLLRSTLENVVEQSSKYGFAVHYAIKANFDARLLREIKSFGLGVDCVSGNEVKCAIEAGFDSDKIVFAGVAKTDDEIIYALENNIFSFNCESKEELFVINQLAMERDITARVALRINPDVDPQTHKYISTGKADNKFGISYSEVDDVLEAIDNLNNIEIVGLHFHIGSQILNLEVFKNLCDRVNTIAEWFESKGVRLDHLNVGGGLGIDYVDPDKNPMPDFKAYFKIFNDNIDLRENQTLHFELGRSIVGQCGSLVTRVLFNKTTGTGKHFVLVDAGMTDLIRPALYQASHKIENISSSLSEQVYTIGGPVCESSDIFARDITLPQTRRGDVIVLRSAGAYGSAMASAYNLRDIAPSVYSISE